VYCVLGPAGEAAAHGADDVRAHRLHAAVRAPVSGERLQGGGAVVEVERRRHRRELEARRAPRDGLRRVPRRGHPRLPGVRQHELDLCRSEVLHLVDEDVRRAGAGPAAHGARDDPAVQVTHKVAEVRRAGSQGWHFSPRYYWESKHRSIDDSQYQWRST
jgi:hypothetical protein